MIERDSTVLPEPDSPTTPSVLPRSRLNETPSTACTVPRSVSNWVWRSSTSSSGTVERRVGEPLGRRCALAREPHSTLPRTSKRARTTSPR